MVGELQNVPNVDGGYTSNPAQAIAYVSAHDDLNLYAQIETVAPDKDTKALDKFAMSIVLTSNGVPFIFQGDEFLYSHALNNTEEPFTWIDDMGNQEPENVKDNLDTFDFYRSLILMRKNHPAVFSMNADDTRNNSGFLDGSRIGNNVVMRQV